MSPHSPDTSARLAPTWRLWLVVGILAISSGCANVLFERSPYAIRGLDVVYSQQEDITFLAWRLRDSADPDLVSFELWRDGDWRPIALDDALFPAEPWECGEDYLCFQFQLPGDYTWPDEVERPLRSIHATEGVYAGSLPRPQTIATTFGIDPIALGRNDEIDPRRFDWFATAGVPLRRDYQWQLVDSTRFDYLGRDAQTCLPVTPGGWGRTEQLDERDRITPAAGWTDAPRCLVMRPDRRDADGVTQVVAFPPSAELAGEQQTYLPREERAPVIYLYLVDLLVRSQTRCDRARQAILGRIDANFGARAPGAVRLGSFTPLDPETGRPLSGCDQRADQDYPVRQMIAQIKAAAAALAPQRVRFVLVYLNNVELPPSNRILLQLLEFIMEVESIDNAQSYGLAVASNLIIELLEWNATVGWRPIDDETFLADLKAWGDITLPFRTMQHDADTEVRITAPVGVVEPPLRFKICEVTPPTVTGVGLEPGLTNLPAGRNSYAWPPDGGVPHYTTALEPQVLIPFENYQRQEVTLDMEACLRFCDMPFRASSGVDFDNWNSTGACQWRP